MARVKIGDVVELKTAKGLSYAQFIHKHSEFGALLLVFSGFHESRPIEFEKVVKGTRLFMCFFPLGAAVHRGIFPVVGNVAPPSDLSKFPTFRAGAVGPDRKVKTWWLWDGDQEWPIGELTEEQRKLSIRGIWNDTLLINRIESGWTPETDPSN